jgi:uncharacterized membrane protein
MARPATPFHALFASLVAAQLAYPAVPAARQPQATRGVVALMLATSAADAVRARGARRALALLGSAGAVGFAAELLGTATGRPFGRYRYSDRLGLRARGVPLAAAAAWAMMGRPAWTVGGLLAGRRRALRVPASTMALCAWDVFLDPRMVRDGYWEWDEGGRYEGVPASNYLGWLLTGVVLFAAWSPLDGRRPQPCDDGALGLYLWTWTGETVANAVLWRRPRVALAGGAAMGALALPATLARLRASRP